MPPTTSALDGFSGTTTAITDNTCTSASANTNSANAVAITIAIAATIVEGPNSRDNNRNESLALHTTKQQ